MLRICENWLWFKDIGWDVAHYQAMLSTLLESVQDAVQDLQHQHASASGRCDTSPLLSKSGTRLEVYCSENYPFEAQRDHQKE